MGNSLSSVIKGVIGDSDDDKSTRDTLNALYELGKSRTETALAQAQQTSNTIYAPISKVIMQKQKIVCNTAVNTDKIVDDIKGGINSLIQGQILDGVTDIIKEGLNIVLGESSGSIASQNTYALIATDIGSLMRIDTDIYNFETSTTRLQTTAKRVTAITMLISSVKLDSLSANDIRAVVSLKYSSSPAQRQQEILNLVMAAWKSDQGKGPSPEADLAEFRSLLKPSQYEQAAIRNSGSLGGTESGSSDIEALKKAQHALALRKSLTDTRSAKVKPDGDKVNGTGQEPTVDPPAAFPLDVVIPLSLPAKPLWVNQIHGFFDSSLPVNGAIKSLGTATMISGDCVTFKFSVTDAEKFSDAVAYFKDTIFPDLNNSGQLAQPCSSFRLEYELPLAAAPIQTKTAFLGNSVAFDNAFVTNNTGSPLQFYDSNNQRLLSLQAGASAVLNGILNYLVPNNNSQWRTEATPPPAVVTGPVFVTTQVDQAGRVTSYNLRWNHGTIPYDWQIPT